jgi:Lon protease-like protein
MQSTLLPLFPLQTVLLPGELLPLHIFEDRYRAMIALVLREDSAFGVVLGAPGGIAGIGCTARVQEVVKEYPDGRLDLMTVGVHRFRVLQLDDSEPYLRGAVEYFGDSDLTEPPPQLRRDVVAMGRQAFPAAELDRADRKLSFALGQEVESLELRQVLLGMLSERERLEHLAEVLPALIERQHLRGKMQTLAPRNGHSGHFVADGKTE